MQVTNSENIFGLECKFRKLFKFDKATATDRNGMKIYNADFFCIAFNCVKTCRVENCFLCKRD